MSESGLLANLDNDHTRIYRRIYDSLYDHLDPNTIPHAVVILGDYQYKSAFVQNQEINIKHHRDYGISSDDIR